ncbi:hypothetical protein EI77_04040 [Prosthecobacter fusiformis]|uniref:Glycosyl hydrolase family 32 n=1 Tax=Prosthecobacter fusiformis TaxID=48464 RepID=A0A4R7RKH2_9BACT|nr:hypothetical protein [Prosthecobacter fusiformis]TDU64589.1 hypothetical protein EI77_04040 [Prosthecobacter fusiformis]
MKKYSPHVFMILLGCLHGLAGQMTAQPLRHLFLDPAFVEKSEKVALHVNPPQQREVVIRPDKPWEQLMISLFLTVLDEGDKVRMWYICRDKNNVPNVAYAESTDGVNWIKPNLDIVEYEGSTDNNLVGMSSLEGTVYRDERAPADERYIYLTHLLEKDGGMVRFYSPDGLCWKRDAEPLVKFGADSQAVTFWDERVGKYALYLRGWEQRADSYLYRTVVRVDLPSLTSPLAVVPTEKSRRLWGKENPAVIDTEFPKVLATDEADPPNSDVYTISAQPYPLDPRWYVGFPSFFQRIDARKKGRLDVQFVGSRDGFQWHRYDRQSYANPGIVGSGSEGMVFMGPNLVVRGDELWQYGTGFYSIHGDSESRKQKADGLIFRYVQRVDGFVSLDFEAEGGRAMTAPVKVDGSQLALNVDTSVLGTLRAGLADAEGNVIEGFSAEDCEILRTNSTHARVTWKGGSNLVSLQGRDVRLIFTGARAKLYSFYFTSDQQ